MPLFIGAGTLTVQLTHGWSQVRSWWLALDSSFYYGVVVPAALLLLIDTPLMLYLRAELAVGVSMLVREKSWVQNM